ncbi:LOW QUALITY PROTEIN: hypothetical protein ACHAWO_002028, partial [Cyclotella atomus]
KLTLVFEEASDQFGVRRQRLNELALEKCEPKNKSIHAKPKLKIYATQPLHHESSIYDEGKAGEPIFHVIVGRVSVQVFQDLEAHADDRPRSIDLHGSTKQEAIDALNNILPSWIDAAMKSHPWTIHVDKITGCGGQVLAEGVEQWIREKRNVRRRSSH